MDQNLQQQNQNEQKKQQLINDIDYIYQLMDKEYKKKLNVDQQKIYNIFLLGPSGGGKSTIANELNDVRIVFQTEDDESFICSKQQNENMKFKVAECVMSSQTDKPQAEKVNQYQVWDLPGYFDSRSSYKDLKNIVFSQSLIQESQYSQIVVVLPVREFYERKLSTLVQILNNIHTDQEISISLIISMVSGQKLSAFKDKLQELLKQTRLQEEGKILLTQILQQNRVILFEVPVQNPQNEEVYEFNQLSIQQIKNQLFNPELFISHKQVQLKPPDETKNTLQEIYSYYLTSIRFSIDKLIKQLLSFNIKYIISDNMQELEETKSDNDAEQQLLNRNINNYNFFVEQFQQDFKREQDFQKEQILKWKQIDNIFLYNDINRSDDYWNVYQQSEILYIQCIHITAKQLRDKLKQFKGVQTIFICCFLSFKLDRNLILPGITLHINTNYFIVEKLKDQDNTKIILKGQDGVPFNPPKASQSQINPQDGEEGQVGNNGLDGGNLFIEAKRFRNLDIFRVNVSGGNGGQGQEGGDGKNGQDGQDGELINDNNKKDKKVQTHEIEQTVLEDLATFHNTYIKIYESRGTAGQIGGNAGSGGLGGYGGRAGQFRINTEYAKKVRNKDGQLGPNGENGKPGRGGQTGKTFIRKLKQKKAFGAIRQHENLVQKQDVKARIGANVASLGVYTVASVFGTLATEVKKLISKNNEWLDDGSFHIEDTFAESGQVNEPKNQRDIQREVAQIDGKQDEMSQFVKQTYEKWQQNQWIKEIQNEIY